MPRFLHMDMLPLSMYIPLFCTELCKEAPKGIHVYIEFYTPWLHITLVP